MNLSTEELETQELKPETLGTAIQSIRTNGYVLFEGVLPDEQVSDLHSSFIDVPVFLNYRSCHLHERDD